MSETTDVDTTFAISGLSAQDTGDYSLLLKNKQGSTTANFRIVITGICNGSGHKPKYHNTTFEPRSNFFFPYIWVFILYLDFLQEFLMDFLLYFKAIIDTLESDWLKLTWRVRKNFLVKQAESFGHLGRMNWSKLFSCRCSVSTRRSNRNDWRH